MKFVLFVIFIVLLLYSSTATCSLTVDKGASWSHKYTETYRGDWQNWAIMGDNFYKTGKYTDALSSYERALEFGEKDLYYSFDYGVIENHMGDSLYKLGRYEEALLSYSNAWQGQGQEVFSKTELLNDQGVVLLALEMYQDALSAYNAITSLYKYSNMS